MGNPIKLAARHIQGGLIPAFVLGILTALSAEAKKYSVGGDLDVLVSERRQPVGFVSTGVLFISDADESRFKQ